MRFWIAVLSIMLLPGLAGAQESTLPFSAPPKDVPDFTEWATRGRDTVTLTVAANDAGAIAKEILQTGLCSKNALPCSVLLRAQVTVQFRCIAQNDQEYDCRQRMAWKRRDIQTVIVRYVMMRGDAYREGFAYEPETGIRYFERDYSPTPAWREIRLPDEGPTPAHLHYEELYKALVLLVKEG